MMGKDRRKKDRTRKEVDSSVPVDVGSEPKALRGPKNSESQEKSRKDDSKNVDSSLRDKILDHSPSQSESKPDLPTTSELFANLKRETEDIKALKHQKPRRQILSNWARYEEPLPGPDREVELLGADFEALVIAPHSGHFRFKSERSWDADVTSKLGELFTLDADLLADGLATIPLYQKLDLPVSLFSAAELEDMDHYAKKCAVRYETTKSISSRNGGNKKGLDATACNLLNSLLTNEDSPVPPDGGTANRKTSAALTSDITHLEAPSDDLYTESITIDGIIDNDSNTETNRKNIPETGSVPDFSEVTSTQEAHFSKTSVSRVPPQNVVDAERQHYSIPTEEINHETKLMTKNISGVVTPRTEVSHSSGAGMTEGRKQVTQQSDFERTESVGPLDQRPGRHKSRHQAQGSEVQQVDSQKSRQPDDLDFLLTLKKPAKEVQISGLRPSQVTKPTIEDDDDTVAPNSSHFPLAVPQKETEDLEDWLDSVLDD